MAEQDRDLLSSVREGYYDGPDSADMHDLIVGIRNLSTDPDDNVYDEMYAKLIRLSALLNELWEKTKESAVKGGEAAQKIVTALDKYKKRRDVLRLEIDSYSRSAGASENTDVVNEKRAELSRLESLIMELEGHREQFSDILDRGAQAQGGRSQG